MLYKVCSRIYKARKSCEWFSGREGGGEARTVARGLWVSLTEGLVTGGRQMGRYDRLHQWTHEGLA